VSWQIDKTEAGVRIGMFEPQTTHSGQTVLFVFGRGDSLELREPVAARLAEAGHQVVAIEHRGQGGSGRLGDHPDAVHIDDFDEHLSVAEQALCQIHGPVHLLSHSMGGLVALKLLSRHPKRFSSAVFSSPMWDFADAPLWVTTILSTLAVAFGKRRQFALSEQPFNVQTCLSMRTTSEESADALIRFSEDHRELVRGGSTWGWVRAAAKAMLELRRTSLAAVRTPTLIVSCTRDNTVSLTAHERFLQRFPRATRLELNAAHGPFFGDFTSQQQLWAGVTRMFAA
jgi:lysophospholipase